MISGCKILQVLSAIVIVLLVLITIMLLIGVMAGSNAAANESTEPNATAGGMAGYGAAAILIWAGINIGITALFMKIWGDCAKRQDILEKYELSRKPKELEGSLKNLKGMAGVGVAVAAELPKETPAELATSPVEAAPQET